MFKWTLSIGLAIAMSGLLGSVSQEMANHPSRVQAPSDMQADIQNESSAERSGSDIQHANQGWRFEQVNGISLSDQKEDILRKLGKPDQIHQDPYFPETIQLQYDTMIIGMTQGSIDYVTVPRSADFIEVDGREIDIDKQEIYKRFGEPDSIASDGVAFCEGPYCMKVYWTDVAEGQAGAAKEIEQIDYFIDHTYQAVPDMDMKPEQEEIFL
ncbi:hypothetical protein [Marinicrinis sediminis]|uniref:Uncharacterized protein n=1 Tax=Marinicrinis sediminis TaxID=1652465 RepID=A0ABW5R7I1_9BACL